MLAVLMPQGTNKSKTAHVDAEPGALPCEGAIDVEGLC